MRLTKAKLTKEMLETVATLSSAKAAEVLGVGKTTVTDARAKFKMKPDKTATPKSVNGKSATFEDKGNGSLIIETTDSVPQTKDHIDQRMRARGFNPEEYTFGYGFSEWEAQTPNGIQTLYSARANAVAKKAVVTGPSADEILAEIGAYEWPVYERPSQEDFEPNTFVFGFADPQIGKTDIRGGTTHTIERFMNSLARAEGILRDKPATEIVWADLGDGIENFCNTSSQRQTNDLNLVEQVRVLRRLQWEGLKRLSAFAPVAHVTVPSNHAQNRVTFQSPASTSHDDWGIEVQEQLREMYDIAAADFANPVQFFCPAEHLESVGITTNEGTKLGFVHGHRSNSQKSLDTWWAGQSLGRQPTWDADLLLVGHFHNLDVTSCGNERYIITFPSLDNGSSWFTVSRGHVATAGVLTFRVRNKMFSDMVIA